MIDTEKEELLYMIKHKYLLDNYVISKGTIYIKIEINALGNAQGGFLILGIDNKYNIKGIRSIDLNIKTVNDYIKYIKADMKKNELVDYSKYRSFDVDDKSIIIIEVPEYAYTIKPVKLGLYYFIMRNKKLSKLNVMEQLYFASVNGTNPDEHKESKLFEIHNIDYSLLNTFIKKVRTLTQDNEISDYAIEHKYYLRDDKAIIRFVKMISFGIYPQKYYPNLNIVMYDSRFEEMKMIHVVEGNIKNQLQGSLVFLKQYLGLNLYIDKDGNVIKNEMYPDSVLSETIYNAIIHRDYSKMTSGKSVEIIIKEDSLIIRNPGCYYYEGNITTVYKNPRNVMIKKVNDILIDMSNKNRGIKNIIKNMKNYGYINPKITYHSCVFEVELFNKSTFDFYKGNITIKNICEFCITPRTREEIYKHFKPNGNSTPYHFINKYIVPLINNVILKYTNLLHLSSKEQKIVVNDQID